MLSISACKEMVKGNQWQHTERYSVGRLACADKQMDRRIEPQTNGASICSNLALTGQTNRPTDGHTDRQKLFWDTLNG